MLERATVRGRAVDGNGLPVVGATIWAAESDDSTTTDAEGRFTLRVPAESTITLRGLKEVYTGTSVQPFALQPDATLDGLEVRMIPGSTLALLNNYVSGNENHGVVAVNVVSLSASCTAEGGTTRLTLVPTAKALYVRDGQHAPDLSLMAMQRAGEPNAWIAGIPAGTGYELVFEKSGCRQLALPVRWRGAEWRSGLRVTRGLTVANVFVE